MEKRTKINMIKVEMECDECKKGTMEQAYPELSSMLTNVVPSYLHKCDECGAEKEYSRPYPKIEYEDVK